jgi:hypothetical protein
MAVDQPVVNQVVSQNFVVSGWALDLSASSGAGVDAVHVWAHPVGGGGPLFVGMGTLQLDRNDVASAFGNGQMRYSGFVVNGAGTLPPGFYDLLVFARSTVTGSFNNWRVIRIRVV